MNREIKFRYVYKHKKDGDYQFVIFTLSEIENGDAIKDIGYMAKDGYMLISRDRYTGLKDKNGKEIYEGDIIKYTWDDREKIDYIAYEAPMFTPSNAIRWGLDEDEVIGNVHDNPELLGGAVNG